MKRRAVFIAFFVLFAVLIVAGYAVPWRGMSAFERWREMRSGIIFHNGGATQPVLALTFDDGPDPRYTPRVLDILKQEHVKATFFLCGQNVARYPNLARRIVEEGHELGNHTETHPRLEKEHGADVRRELETCERRLEGIIGKRTHLFRPPRGLWNPTVFADARRMGYKIILWSLAFDRAAIKDSSILRRRVVNAAKPGDIILMHDGSASTLDERRPTIQELEGLIDGLKHRGFSFATVPQLLKVPANESVGPPREITEAIRALTGQPGIEP